MLKASRAVIDYKTRDLGDGTWEGTVDAWVTEEVDTWGKRTILVKRPGKKLWEEYYLFDDEWRECGEAEDVRDED